MGLDPIGAKATNLTACSKRQNPYLHMCEVVTKPEEGLYGARLWASLTIMHVSQNK